MVDLIVGYYGAAFYGGGTYFKLSKNAEEKQYKFEYCHQAVPNYIPKAEEYIKKYDTLKVEEERFKEYFEGKIIEIYLDYNFDIEKIIRIVSNSNWDNISKNEYTSESFDDVCWNFYFESKLSKNYFIQGYSVYPNEIKTIYNTFKEMKEKYIGEIEPNKKDLENILSHKKSNLSFSKYMAKKGMLGYTKKMVKEEKEKYKQYEKKLKEIYNKETDNN